MSTQALLAALATQAEIELDNTHKKIAGAYLEAFRTLLQPYNLKRHPLKIVDYHGETTLMIGDFHYWQLRSGRPLTDLLSAIGDEIDTEPWGKHLVGTIL